MIRRAALLLLLVACRDADRVDPSPSTTDATDATDAAEAPTPAPAARPAQPPELPPDGERLLVRWTGEGEPVFAVVDAITGEAARLPARGKGYRLAEPFGWMDARRVLFATRRLFGDESRPVGRGGLAVHDLATGEHRQITDVPEGVFLHPLAKWGAHGVVVGEAVARGPAGEGGEPPRDFARVRGNDLRVAWSPDGRRLVVSREGRTRVIEPRPPG